MSDQNQCIDFDLKCKLCQKQYKRKKAFEKHICKGTKTNQMSVPSHQYSDVNNHSIPLFSNNECCNDMLDITEIDEHSNTNLTTYTYIDLFAGTGAFSLIFESLGCYKCVFSNDIEPASKTIYNANIQTNNFKLGDLSMIPTTHIPKHNILCGGFPCQPFSIAGQQKGFDDKRSNVFWKILDIMNAHKPDIVLLENVKNLKSHDKGNTYNTIYEHISKAGYHIKTCVLDTSKITNIPHHRERIYIVCFLDKSKYEQFSFDFEVTNNDKCYEFIEHEVDDKYYYTDKIKAFDDIQKNVKFHINDNVIYQYRRYYVRENKGNCCPTLTANMGTGGHNVPLIKDDKGIRKLTPRECFNFQGFPRNYILPVCLSDCSLYKLAGNAVSIPVIKKIIYKIHDLL